MFVFKADNMLLHQLHSIPELQLQNIRMAPQKNHPKTEPKNPKQMNKKIPSKLKKNKPQKQPNRPCSPNLWLPTTVSSE